MKLRIKGNSVRLRLSRTDVHTLAAKGKVTESTLFSRATFRYTLESRKEVQNLSADFEDRTLSVFIPEEWIAGWFVSDRVGFENTIHSIDGESLYLLVEKDFQCLDNTEEDQSDHYGNPNSTCRT